MSDNRHLDGWRIKLVGDGEGRAFAFGPIHLLPKWRSVDADFVAALAATPKHGMLWSDAEAQGFMQAQVGKEASNLCARINRAWRASVCERAGTALNNIGPIVRSCPTHGRGTPMCIVIHDGLAWMEAWRAAVVGKVRREEVLRLNAITGLNFKVGDLAKPDGWATYHEEPKTIGFKWRDWRRDHPMYRAIMALSLINGDNPYDWGDLKCVFHWGWLSDKDAMAKAIEEFLGENAPLRFGFVRKTTISWEPQRPDNPCGGANSSDD